MLVPGRPGARTTLGPVPPPLDLPRSRRDLLRAGGLGLVATAGLSLTAGCGTRPAAGPGTATGDDVLATRLAAAVARARVAAEAAAQAAPAPDAARAWRELATLHRRHARELPAPPAEATTVPRGPSARAVAGRAELGLADTAARVAVLAASGPLALLAGSVRAALAQRLLLDPVLGLPRPDTGAATVDAAVAAVPAAPLPVEEAGEAHAAGLATALAAEHAAVAVVGTLAARLPAALSPGGHDRLLLALARHRARRDALALTWPSVARTAPAAAAYDVPSTSRPAEVIAALATVERRCADAAGFLLANAPATPAGARTGRTGRAGDRPWALATLVDAAVQDVDAGAGAGTWPGRV